MAAFKQSILLQLQLKLEERDYFMSYQPTILCEHSETPIKEIIRNWHNSNFLDDPPVTFSKLPEKVTRGTDQ